MHAQLRASVYGQPLTALSRRARVHASPAFCSHHHFAESLFQNDDRRLRIEGGLVREAGDGGRGSGSCRGRCGRLGDVVHLRRSRAQRRW